MECIYQTRLCTNCVLCLRSTGKLSNENKCWLNKIEDLYFIYLKPKLVTATKPVNWDRVVKASFSYCPYCSDCIKAGQKLTSLNDRLLALQCEIQAFVENLSEEILKYREDVNPGVKKLVDTVVQNPQHFADYSAPDIEIKNEDESIKEELEIASIYTEEEEDPLEDYVDSHDPLEDHVDLQDHLKDHVDSHDSLEDHVDSNNSTSGDDESSHRYIEEQDIIIRKTAGSKNQNRLAIEKKTTNSKNIQKIQSRKLVVSLQRLEDRFNRKPVATKRKLDKNESEKLLNARNIEENNSTIPRQTRGRKQSFKHLLDQYEVDFDIYGNEIKSLPNVTSDSIKKLDTDKRTKLEENEYDKLLDTDTRNPDETNSTNLSRTRGKKQSFKHLLDQYEVDFDIDGNEIKSFLNETSDSKNDDSDFELEDEADEQVDQTLSGENTSENKEPIQRNLKCLLCSKRFKNVDCFQAHMFKKHKRTIAPCNKCDKIFMDRETRSSHLKSVHKTCKLFSCPVCPDLENIHNLYEFEMHNMTHTEEIPYDCPKCHEKFSNARNYCEHQKSSVCANSDGEFACTKCNENFKAKCLLFTHMAVFHKGNNMRKRKKLFQCEICENFETPKFYLEDHYAEEHTEEFIIPCDICGMSLQSLEKFDKHRKSHRASVAIPCNLCDKTFGKPSHLKIHIQNRHSKKEDISERICKHCGKKFVGCKKKYSAHIVRCNMGYFCDICGKQFHIFSLFKDHITFHNVGFPTCTICNIEYKSKCSLRAHMTNVHLKNSFVCELCGAIFNAKQSLKNHIRFKHSENPSFKCKICGENFYTAHKLRIHYDLVHKGESYSCQYCSEKFPTRGALKSHEDSKHWEVRNKDIKCTACTAVFKKNKERAKHRLLMHPELVISRVNKQCQLCNKVFTGADALKRHMRRHDRDKDGSFQCELCNRTFLKQRSLTWHMTKDHNIKRSK